MVGADTALPFNKAGINVKSISFTQTIWVTHSASGTGSSSFNITFTITFSYTENTITSFTVSKSGFGKIGNYELRDYGVSSLNIST